MRCLTVLFPVAPLFPFVQVWYFDLGMESRDATKDQVTVDAAKAIQACNVGIKWSTDTHKH